MGVRRRARASSCADTSGGNDAVGVRETSQGETKDLVHPRGHGRDETERADGVHIHRSSGREHADGQWRCSRRGRSALPTGDSTGLPDAVIARVLLHSCGRWIDVLRAAAVDNAWLDAVLSTQLASSRRDLCLRVAAPRAWLQSSLFEAALGKPGWTAFWARQESLQRSFSGRYVGVLTPSNVFDHSEVDDFDWEQEHQVVAVLEPLSASEDRPGRASQRVFAGEEELGGWGCGTDWAYEWMVLDRRHPFDSLLWRAAQAGVASAGHTATAESRSSRSGGAIRNQRSGSCAPLVDPEHPEERWEDGDCFCGVRGTFDFRPVVDPEFVSLAPFGILLVPSRTSGSSGRSFFWAPRLYAPCAWMFPKSVAGQAETRQALCLDVAAEFRDERTVAALTLGVRLERALTYDALSDLAAAVQRVDGAFDAVFPEASGTAASAVPSSRKAKRVARSEKRTGAAGSAGNADPRNQCSGRNRKGLNFFIPRRKEMAPRVRTGSSGNVGHESRHRVPRDSLLRCSVDAPGLAAFLEAHRPSQREVERLCLGCPSSADSADVTCADSEPLALADPGLLEDAARMERSGMLSQATIVELARKWKCLSGKWLLFVPEWRIDDLFVELAQRLRAGALNGCTNIVVSPPGAFGTDSDTYMLGVRSADFTDKQQVMALGKSLRAAARHGLRVAASSGAWGELQDDPFASRGRRVPSRSIA